MLNLRLFALAEKHSRPVPQRAKRSALTSAPSVIRSLPVSRNSLMPADVLISSDAVLKLLTSNSVIIEKKKQSVAIATDYFFANMKNVYKLQFIGERPAAE